MHVEFNVKHTNWYGYMALVVFALSLTSFLMIQNRACQISFQILVSNNHVLQSFHLTVMIVALIIFILSYFNFSVIMKEYTPLLYIVALITFACAGFLIYNVVDIFRKPCKSSPEVSLLGTYYENIFKAGDAIGITVFFFDLISSALMIFAGVNMFQKSV